MKADFTARADNPQGARMGVPLVYWFGRTAPLAVLLSGRALVRVRGTVLNCLFQIAVADGLFEGDFVVRFQKR